MMVTVQFTRGEILTCGTCPEQVLVIKRNELPAGWFVVIETSKAREITPRLICPTCNAAEVERWNP